MPSVPKKKALVFFAPGLEEGEAVMIVDILRRSGVEVTTASLGERRVVGSRGVPLEADVSLAEVGEGLFDAVILPGGGAGSQNLAESLAARELTVRHHAAGKIIAALCAAPATALASWGLLKDRRATCFPGLETRFAPGTLISDDRVVVDGAIITSRALGTALEFSLVLAQKLVGEEVAQKVRESILSPTSASPPIMGG